MAVGQALQNFLEVGVGFAVVELGGCDHRTDAGPAVGAITGTGEQMILCPRAFCGGGAEREKQTNSFPSPLLIRRSTPSLPFDTVIEGERMRYLALVTDYDGTLATDGLVSSVTAAAIDRLRTSGRHAIMATGRRLNDLLAVCPLVDLFSYVIAENGALLYEPKTQETTLLSEPLPDRFLRAVKDANIAPIEIGSVIVATHVPNQEKILGIIQELGLELKITFNRGSVMILPTGINKAFGTKHALRKLGMSPHEIVAVGDSENDHSLLNLSECPVAVANALDAIKEVAAFITKSPAGEGVTELIDELIVNDLKQIDARLIHRHIVLGTRLDRTVVRVPPYGPNILVAGSSGSGKSTLAAGFIERLIEKSYQVCIVDPEGDYVTVPSLVTIGDQGRPPSISEALGVLQDPDVNVNVNLLGVPLLDRPHFFTELFLNLQAMRARIGRPHWLVLDEAHHLLPATWGHARHSLPQKLGETLLITVHPSHVAPAILSMVDVAIAVGPSPLKTLQDFGTALGKLPFSLLPDQLTNSEGDVTCWLVQSGQDPFPMHVTHGKADRIRHFRKYAVGDLKWHSFWFRGPNEKHNLSAPNLSLFCHIGRGIDEETWLFHLRRGDYSRWIRDSVRDKDLAEIVRQIEERSHDPQDSRSRICDAIEAKYSLNP
ncbi:HAD-IIB family hydrolase [Enhydrobacter sp.]|jgi:hydroxymethylpyrimidine pyrophosphatase-like HAD family hydrolase|uniref:HAD-IIB family hydrolase n=1 Tax=Enhydrobacter sp. TaxID=1894999 RepID=UPI002636CBE5|nr:HAD-IIB family hydrolase [Enhydrobacter sp.]